MMRPVLCTPTPDKAVSVAFYERIGFRRQSDAPAAFADGNVLIEIDESRFARPGLKLFDADWGAAIERLQKDFPVHETDEGWLVVDPSNVHVRLVRDECPYPAPRGAEAEAGSALGTFAGLSLESGDMARSIAFWESLGFERGDSGGDMWASCTCAAGLTVTVMRTRACPHLFFNPSFTYFNGEQNPAIIAGLRELGVPFAEEVTCFNDEGIVDNVILRDPGGWGFFVFND